MRSATKRTDPVTVTGHYLAPARPGPVDVSTDILKRGKRFSTARATLFGPAGTVLTALGTFGELEHGTDVVLAAGEPPEIPGPEGCVRVQATDSFPPPFAAHVEARLHPDDATFLTGRPSGRPGIRAWLRFPDEEPVDSIALLCLVDALPPTIFNADFPIRWTPTIELTAHVRARPGPGWLRTSSVTRFISNGFLEIDVEIWDSGDRLVAQARQLALLPSAEPPARPDVPNQRPGGSL
jgi:acyl-coenzyme A thioesterase PaaI-like protein